MAISPVLVTLNVPLLQRTRVERYPTSDSKIWKWEPQSLAVVSDLFLLVSSIRRRLLLRSLNYTC